MSASANKGESTAQIQLHSDIIYDEPVRPGLDATLLDMGQTQTGICGLIHGLSGNLPVNSKYLFGDFITLLKW